ncbi:ferredoxin [Candidatus Falkowbacteria bacterium CG10_big_fil_rev_8_21_14_0_10_39_9]|uniref:Ferredoxin n=1 Tax=Candidatus Falkowbacteria bacterium CG10_big_fil_rev_8_21_14_0_10_39_9 TaxID=1974566 RepID=A0A2M6WR34_9BACT|nr:MAG: ferredoxin [Candidatus Falkowbacteria bacterium CG10_big_fil_rev_8_21_14_0_10_39_9]
MAIKVDDNKCIGCGMCASMCPNVFKINSAGKSEVISSDDKECASSAAKACPVMAISVD